MFHERRDILDNMHAYFSQNVGKRHVSQMCFSLMPAPLTQSKVGSEILLSLGPSDADASRWLVSCQDKWLMIFDNADDSRINLFTYFPQSSHGNILITSRNPQLYVHAPDSHHRISDMEEEDAVRLLLATAIEHLTTEIENIARDIRRGQSSDFGAILRRFSLMI
jgi:hypothetical protein